MLVERLRPDDPRLLEPVDRNKLLVLYWISAALIALGAVGAFIWTRWKRVE